MKDIERYIRSHVADFDTQEPAPGHEERFLARLDAKPASTAARSFFGNRSARLLVYALAAFTAALLVLRPSQPRDFRFVPDDPEAIYLAYMDQVAGLYGAVPAGDSVAWDATMEEITEEGVPLFEQLPDELSRREQARILKAYYSELLEGARQLTKSTK